MKGIFRPELFNECEMCEICNRGVGMVIDDRKITPHPFMCWVCAERFPEEQWSIDEDGFFFDLRKNGRTWMEGSYIKSSLKNEEIADES